MADPGAPDPADSVSLRIEATPEALYDLVSDPANMGRLSPECTGGSWIDGATGPVAGARFKGTNKRGPIRWSTKSVVVDADRGRAFSFDVEGSGTLWSYTFEPDGTGTVVTESRRASKPYPFTAKVFTTLFLGGIDGHTQELREGMAATLQRLKDLAEAPA
jgi:hypothetical protein